MLTTAGLVLFVVLLPLVSGDLIVYPSAIGAPKSNKFQISLSQDGSRRESFVYISSSDHRAREAPHVRPGRTMSWTSFAFTGSKVTVEVHAPHDFNNCIVRPKSYAIQCQHAGPRIAKFDVQTNTKMMSVEFDYDYGDTGLHDITDKLMVFADPPETHIPNKNDPHVMYYDVGVYNLSGQVEVGAKTEVYLAPGAFVSGGFITSQDHPVKIYGRGIIDNRDYAWHDSRFKWAAVNMDIGSGNTVEGITISDSMAFFLRMLSPHATISNVKTVGAWINNNDGFSTGDNGVIHDSFVHANDDAIKLYSPGMRVSRCVIWQGLNGGVFQTGWWSARDIHDVEVTDIDVIHTDWCSFTANNCTTSPNNAVFDQAGNTSSFAVSNIEFVNIRVEGSCPRIIYWKMPSGAHGTASNVLFTNWDVDSQPNNDSTLHNEIAGAGSTGHVSNWLFSNFKIGGHCVSDPSSADFRIDPGSTRNIAFRCGGGVVG